MTGVDDLTLVTGPSEEYLNERQLVDYRAKREACLEWLLHFGKDPSKADGYAFETVRARASRMDMFYRWVWSEEGRYVADVTYAHADTFEEALAKDDILTDSGEPYSEGSRRKLVGAAEKFHLWQARVHGGEPWSSDQDFTESAADQVDYFTLNERERLFEAALSLDDLGDYGNLSTEVRDRVHRHLAQKLEKPKEAVTRADYEALQQCWKIPALVSTSLELGPRPALFERLKQGFYQPEKGVIRIPRGEAVKNEQAWECSLSTRSTRLLNRWLPQRATRPKYDDSELLWLNREGNPYRSGTLNYLLETLLEEAGIDQLDRSLSWYSIRRSTGTYLTYFQSLAFAARQLRHTSLQSTLRYAEVPVEAGQDALDQLSSAFAGGSADLPSEGAEDGVLDATKLGMIRDA